MLLLDLAVRENGFDLAREYGRYGIIGLMHGIAVLYYQCSPFGDGKLLFWAGQAFVMQYTQALRRAYLP